MNIASRTIATSRGLTAVIGLGLILASAQLQAQSQNTPPAPYGPYSSSPSNDAGHNWVPSRPKNPYWQAPGQSGDQASRQGSYNPQANRQTRSAPAQARNPYQQPAQQYSQQYAPRSYGYGQPSASYQQPASRPYSGQSPAYRNTPPGYYGNQSYRPAPAPSYGPSYGPGYSQAYRPPVRPYPRKKKNKRRFWGDTTPKDLMHPTKENWEQAWDDMMLSPYNAGEMPGGWYAPEVYLPNPVDIGDQFKDNAKDLPEQIKDMDVGNTVEDVD